MVVLARHLPAQRGPAAWNILLGPQPPAPILEEDKIADFVVVGAGFAGLAAARRLTQLCPKARIIILEAGSLAGGAAGRNSGFMIDLPHELTSQNYAGSGDDLQMIALNRRAQAFAAEAVEDYAINPNYFDKAGKFNGAATKKAHAHNQSYAQHLKKLGEPLEMLDAKQMSAITGSQHYYSGLYTPGTVMLQPAGYIRGMGAGFVRGGGQLFAQSPVTALTKEGANWRVTTPKGSIQADKVILTVNGHLESFGFEGRRLMHLFLFASMTPELSAEALAKIGGQSRWGITPSDPMGTTMRRIDSAQGGNRLIIRTCASLRPNMRATAGDLQRAKRIMQRKFDNRFPPLAGMQMQYSWAGHLCLSLNGVAVMRELEQGLFSGCVQNGLGTARGTLTGMGAAEMACGKTSHITAHFSAEARPKRLPPRLFQQIGANAMLRMKEWRARKD